MLGTIIIMAKVITERPDRELRGRFGQANGQLDVDEYSSKRIGRAIVALYPHLPAGAPSLKSPLRERLAS
jgi:hypothetical protein